MKFTVGKQLTSGKSQTYSNAGDALQDPMAAAVFAVPGVKMVFVLNDFVTITKDSDAQWETVAPAVQQVLAEQLA